MNHSLPALSKTAVLRFASGADAGALAHPADDVAAVDAADAADLALRDRVGHVGEHGEHFAQRDEKERLVSFVMEENVVPAEGAQIVVEGLPVGRVTSARAIAARAASCSPRK